MKEFTIDDLNDAISASHDAGTRVGEDMLDRPFFELGLDSLALVELAERLQAAYQVPIPDDVIEEIPTPRHALDYVNARLAADRGTTS
ncbi:Actinorhodin polyketide synthase acyl carrier protein [Actinomadura rubteroloni]|uniref:Actinorhodin polyketide synthase acyl carrier protein n=1 Tax=Actinomadura rubteroloni TaxID=1926885 RepID=A0A2P4UET9_9ACTN|nr:acyl carrier protein [Actinomadura rubteroloni]POM23580.1 Actinorhodin polyketide synthase acyl carrier protein [Actinomadura rubteroloni]